MTKTLNVALVILLGGTTSLAIAQSSKESLADTFASMQALSSNSSNWQQEKPAFSQVAKAAGAKFSIREMQALSSDSPVWQIGQGKPVLDYGPTFAQTHPRGLSFSQYQAYASNSGEFAPSPIVEMPSVAVTSTVTVARSTAKPTLP